MNLANPAGEKLEVPFGMFSLNAFNEQVNLSELDKRSEAVREHYNTYVAAQCDEEIAKHAVNNNVSLEKIKEVAPGHTWFSLHVEFANLSDEGSVSQA